MAATFGVCGPSPTVTVIGRPIDRVFEEAQFTGEVILSGRKLRDYPKISDKYDLADTIHTDLSKNRLVEVPREVCGYRSMERLNCYHNYIKAVPNDLSQLQALTHLNLSRNQLTALPVCICELALLEVLMVSNNKLLSLPQQIGQLQRLMDLDASCNEMSQLPSQIGDLRCLRSLNVRRNFLVELPVEICKLNLMNLEISCNRIQKIPAVFCKLEALECMVLEHNPLESPPPHVCRRGRQHVLKFLHMQSIREDRKRGFLSEADMKRLLRKSLPSQPPSDEFRSLLEGGPGEGKWKRHTVLSSDSGYSTADSLDRSGFNQPELSEGMIGEAEDLLALKAGEAVREQRQGHGNLNATTDPAHARKAFGSSSLPLAARSSVSRLPCSGGVGGGTSIVDGKSVSSVSCSADEGGKSGVTMSQETTSNSQLALQPSSPKPLNSISSQSSTVGGAGGESPPFQESDPSCLSGVSPSLPGMSHKSSVISSCAVQSSDSRPCPSLTGRERKESGSDGGLIPTPSSTASSSSSHPGEGVGEVVMMDSPLTPPNPTTLLAQQALGDGVDLSVKQPLQSADEFARELKSQREDYERRKKEAEQIRVAQETEQRSRTAHKFQEDKSTLSNQTTMMTKVDRKSDPHTAPETAQRGGSEGGRRKGKRRSTEEEHIEGEGGKSGLHPLTPSHRNGEEAEGAEEEGGGGDVRGQVEEGPLSKAARTSEGLSKDSSSSSRRIPNCQYRRTSSDSTPRRGIPTVVSSRRQTEDNSHLHKNGDLEEEEVTDQNKPSHSSKQGASTIEQGTSLTQHAIPRRAKGGERSQVPTPTSSRTIPKASSTVDISAKGGGGGGGSNTSTTTTSGVPRSKGCLTPDEDSSGSGSQRQTSGSRPGPESSHPKSRLEDPRSRGSATSCGASKSRGGGGEGESKRVATATRTGVPPTGKGGRSEQPSRLHMSSSRPSALPCKQTTARSLEDVKESTSSRRRSDQPREESQHSASIRQMVESRLKVTLPDQLPDALKDGVVLCHLANHVRPRSVVTIHVPSPAVPKLTSAKARRNVESFLEACHKIGVDQEHLCTATDITEDRGLQRLCNTVTALVALAT